jgi:hypothetical protein
MLITKTAGIPKNACCFQVLQDNSAHFESKDALFPLDGVLLVSAIWCASCYLSATIFIPISYTISSFYRVIGQNLVKAGRGLPLNSMCLYPV